MTDNDLLLPEAAPTFGSGVVGVCDVCGKRQAVIVLEKERFKLCVLDFLNKTWVESKVQPGAPLPLYRSERVWYPTAETPDGRAPAIVLRPTKIVKHPVVLVTPDVYGLTTTLLDGAIRFAREGFEVLLPDVPKAGLLGPGHHVTLRRGPMTGKGVPMAHPKVRQLARLYLDGLRHLRGRAMVDPEKSAIFGASFGGALAIAVAAQDPALSAVVVAYPAPIDPPGHLRLVSAPVLFVDAPKDRMSWRSRSQFMSEFEPSGGRVQYASVPGARAHFLARDMRTYRVAASEAAWARIGEFLRAQLLPPPPKPPTPPAAPKSAIPPAAAAPTLSPAVPPRAPALVPPPT